MTRTITIATRKSELALWQANHVAGLLRDRHPGLQVELLPMVTQGDVILDKPLAQIGGKGLFLKELERALLKGDADIAVHSMKDVPVDEVDGLVVDVMLERANPFDALLSRAGQSLDELPAGARVGTSSVRRRAQLLDLRPDLAVDALRGNVPTRIRRLREGRYDAILLARAGVVRLGLDLDDLDGLAHLEAHELHALDVRRPDLVHLAAEVRELGPWVEVLPVGRVAVELPHVFDGCLDPDLLTDVLHRLPP